LKHPDLQFLPEGISAEDYANMPIEHQKLVQQEMLKLKQETEIVEPDSKAKTPAKRYNGLIEWILDREGHDFLVDIDRAYLKDKSNFTWLGKKLVEELNLKEDQNLDKQVNTFLRHLYKSAAPTKEGLADQKYLQFLQDIVDVYGIIHSRYVLTPEGLAKVFRKFLTGIYGTCPRAFCDN